MVTSVSSSASSISIHQFVEVLRDGWTLGSTVGANLVRSIGCYMMYIFGKESELIENPVQLKEKDWVDLTNKVGLFKKIMGIENEVSLWTEDLFLINPYGKREHRSQAETLNEDNGNAIILFNKAVKMNFFTVSEEEQDFIICHELAHVKNDREDPLGYEFFSTFAFCSKCFLIASVVIPLLFHIVCPWKTALFMGVSLLGMLISKFACSYLLQKREIRADRDACVSLKSVRGGISFLKKRDALSSETVECCRENRITSLLRLSIGFFISPGDHPSDKKRIQCLQELHTQDPNMVH